MGRISAMWLLAASVGVAGCGDIKSGEPDGGEPGIDANLGDDAGGGDPDAAGNAPPVVDAGAGADVVVDATGALVGTASDPDGDALAFQWTQLSGPAVTITAPTALSTDFTAAAPFGTSLVFELEACDASACATDTVAFYVVRTPVLSTYVAPPPLGDDATGDGSRDAPWATVGQGVATGATMTGGGQPVQVRVAAGDYAEAIVMVDDVSIVGGFDTDWVRDPGVSVTRLVSTDPRGVLYETGGGYAGTTELDGLQLEVDGGVTAAAQVAVTVREGTGVLRNGAVILPDAPSLSLGLLVQPTAAASFDVEDTSFSGGSVSATDGSISAISVDGNTAAAAVRASRIAVDVPMPVQRTCFAIAVDGGRFDMVDSSVLVQDVVTADTISTDAAAGIFGFGSTTISVDNSTIDVGAGFGTMAAIASNGGGTLDVTDSMMIGGDVAGAADGALFSYGVVALGGQAMTLSGSTIVGGAVPTPASRGLHTSEAVVATGDTVIDDCDIDAGPGDWGFGVWILDAPSAAVTNSRINQGAGGVSCTSADTCVGIFVEGFTGTLASGQPAPQAPEYSCCDPAHFGIVIENNEVRGGQGHESIGLLVQNRSAAATATACARGNTIDAGDCTPADDSSVCVGVAFVSGQRFALLNNVVYGGVAGGVSVGARIDPEATEPVVSNNYIHGGEPPGAGATTIGLLMGNGRTASGLRVLNNIIDAGSGDERIAAYEEDHNSDPGRFMANDLVVMPSGAGAALYRNCDPTSCSLLTDIADVNTQLTTGGQSTFGQGLCITDATCLTDPTPRTGDYSHAAGSACIDAGLERNAACNICQTPWTDMAGNHRLSTAYSSTFPCSSTGVSMSGDDMPDLGPMED